MENLKRLIKRLEKLEIYLDLTGNYPWIYLDKVNGKRVTETHLADHGFTVAWYPTIVGESAKFTDLKKTFELIRKYAT